MSDTRYVPRMRGSPDPELTEWIRVLSRVFHAQKAVLRPAFSGVSIDHSAAQSSDHSPNAIDQSTTRRTARCRGRLYRLPRWLSGARLWAQANDPHFFAEQAVRTLVLSVPGRQAA